MFADDTGQHWRGTGSARSQGGGVFSPVQGRSDVVTHSAVDCDIEPTGTTVQCDGLDRSDLVKGERAGATDRPARLDRQVRNREAERRAFLVNDLAQIGGKRSRRS